MYGGGVCKRILPSADSRHGRVEVKKKRFGGGDFGNEPVRRRVNLSLQSGVRTVINALPPPLQSSERVQTRENKKQTWSRFTRNMYRPNRFEVDFLFFFDHNNVILTVTPNHYYDACRRHDDVSLSRLDILTAK